jgi:hypothetical protein
MRKYIAATIAPKTARTYKQEYVRYKQFCQLMGINKEKENTILLYATHLADSDSYKTIDIKMAAIKFHLRKKRPLPRMRKLKELLKGIKRTISTRAQRPPRLPITPRELHKIRGNIANTQNKHNRAMLWAATLLSYFGCTRVSEITSPWQRKYNKNSTLCINNIQIDRNQIIMHLKASKTDQFRQGVDVTIAANKSKLCPVRAIRKYVSMRGSYNGPLFIYDHGACLTPQKFNEFIKDILPPTPCGSFSSHSLRIGAASVAAAHGYPKHLIQQLGRWKSDAYLTYIRFGNTIFMELSKKLAIPI